MPVCAAAPAPDIVTLARPLLEDLKGPEYFQSRCLLAPILATDRRVVAMSRDDTFQAGDRILAVNGEPLSATGDRPLHDILIRYGPDATVTVRVLRQGSERDIAAPCSDNRSYFVLLRAAATAAVQDDAATCVDRMAEAGKLHALGAIWLNVALNCNVKAGRVAGAPMLAEYFVVYHEELLENKFSPDALQKVRPSLQEAAQKLLNAGSRPLAEKLQQEYAAAVAQFSPLQGSALALVLQAPPIASPPNKMKPGLYRVQTNAGALVPDTDVGPTFMRMCFTQAMIDAANPVPPTGQCGRLITLRTGNKTHIEFSCNKDGITSTGSSDETINGDSRHSVIDVGTTDKDGTHRLRLETDMVFLGPDCNATYAAPPIPISVRHYRYESLLEADGRTYHLNAEYECRLEGDATQAFNQLEWRFQGRVDRLKLAGKLPDGSPFKVLPLRIWERQGGACPSSTQVIDSEIWLTAATRPLRMERFDHDHASSEHHQVQLIDSQLVLDKISVDPPGTPSLKPLPYVEDPPQYYTVEMISVPAASVVDQKGLKEFTDQRRIPWLSSGGDSYPFTGWSDNDVAFARNYTSIFSTQDGRRGGPGKEAEGLQTHYAIPASNEWLIDRERRNLASQWLPMPAKNDADKNVPRPDPAAMSKTWIVYDGARIEIPLFSYYRVLYDPAHDEYLFFSINRVDAD